MPCLPYKQEVNYFTVKLTRCVVNLVNQRTHSVRRINKKEGVGRLFNNYYLKNIYSDGLRVYISVSQGKQIKRNTC